MLTDDTNMTVYVCSNPKCDAIWDRDPHSHCPACIEPSGCGYSTRPREVKNVPGKDHSMSIEDTRVEVSLLDCPFCGGGASFINDGEYMTGICCSACKANIPFFGSRAYHPDTLAVAAWNTRPSAEHLATMGEALPQYYIQWPDEVQKAVEREILNISCTHVEEQLAPVYAEAAFNGFRPYIAALRVSPPPLPDYDDVISPEQMDAIRKLAASPPSGEKEAIGEREVECLSCHGEGSIEHPHMPLHTLQSETPEYAIVDCEDCQGTGKVWQDADSGDRVPSDGEIYTLGSFGGDQAAKDAFVAALRPSPDDRIAELEAELDRFRRPDARNLTTHDPIVPLPTFQPQHLRGLALLFREWCHADLWGRPAEAELAARQVETAYSLLTTTRLAASREGGSCRDPEPCDCARCEQRFQVALEQARREIASPAPMPEGEITDALTTKLQMVISHATGGSCSDTSLSINDICVRISAHHNMIYQAGKDAALGSVQDKEGV